MLLPRLPGVRSSHPGIAAMLYIRRFPHRRELLITALWVTFFVRLDYHMKCNTNHKQIAAHGEILYNGK